MKILTNLNENNRDYIKNLKKGDLLTIIDIPSCVNGYIIYEFLELINLTNFIIVKDLHTNNTNILNLNELLNNGNILVLNILEVLSREDFISQLKKYIKGKIERNIAEIDNNIEEMKEFVDISNINKNNYIEEIKTKNDFLKLNIGDSVYIINNISFNNINTRNCENSTVNGEGIFLGKFETKYIFGILNGKAPEYDYYGFDEDIIIDIDKFKPSFNGGLILLKNKEGISEKENEYNIFVSILLTIKDYSNLEKIKYEI